MSTYTKHKLECQEILVGLFRDGRLTSPDDGEAAYDYRREGDSFAQKSLLSEAASLWNDGT